MKVPRLRIADFMVFVAIVALDFAALRLMGPRSPTVDLLQAGALPMTNVLAIGLLIAYRRCGSRPFLYGFEATGLAALVVYTAAVFHSGEEWFFPYLHLVMRPLVWASNPNPTPGMIIVLHAIAVVMLGLPQLAFALLGGYLSRKLRLAVRAP